MRAAEQGSGLRASTEAELAERLALQDYLDSLSEAELTGVPPSRTRARHSGGSS